MKVYCKGCKHQARDKYHCNHPDNIDVKVNWWYDPAVIINKNNDCKWYKKKDSK